MVVVGGARDAHRARDLRGAVASLVSGVLIAAPALLGGSARKG